MRYPSTLIDFQTQFPDDAHCWAYLRPAMSVIGELGLEAQLQEDPLVIRFAPPRDPM